MRRRVAASAIIGQLPWPELAISFGAFMLWVVVAVLAPDLHSGYFGALAIATSVSLLLAPSLLYRRVQLLAKDAPSGGAVAVRFAQGERTYDAAAVSTRDALELRLPNVPRIVIPWRQISRIEVVDGVFGKARALRITSAVDGSVLELSLMRPLGFTSARGEAVQRFAERLRDATQTASPARDH